MATRILLLDDVDNVGIKGDIVSVKPGYAFNFLIPKKLALVADMNAIRRQARLKEERRLRAVEDKNAADLIASQLNGQIFTFDVKVDHEGHMYGSVSALDIIHLIKNQVNVELEKKSVQLKHPIKQIGAYDIALRLKEGVEAQIHVKVSAEHSMA
jgi:large subunit ribosomal protein L9